MNDEGYDERSVLSDIDDELFERNQRRSKKEKSALTTSKKIDEKFTSADIDNLFDINPI